MTPNKELPPLGTSFATAAKREGAGPSEPRQLPMLGAALMLPGHLPSPVAPWRRGAGQHTPQNMDGARAEPWGHAKERSQSREEPVGVQGP